MRIFNINIFNEFYNKLKSILLNRSLIYTLINTFLGILITSFIINWTDKEIYGRWLTIYAVCNWINYFDGGLGNSIRNSLSKSIAFKDELQSKKIISTGYLSMSILSIVFIIISLIINLFIDWNTIINDNNYDYKLMTSLIFIAFFIQIFFQTLNKILFSLNKANITFLIPLVNNLIIIILFFIYKILKFNNELILIAITYSIIPIIILILFTIYFLFHKNKKYRPSIHYIDKLMIKSLVFKGLSFFFIQISAGVLQAILPLFITKFHGATFTTEYQLSLKIFMLFLVVQNIFLQISWSSITKYYVQNDRYNTRRLLKSNIYLTIMLIIGLSFIYIISDHIFKIWINKDFIIDSKISFIAFLYVLITLINKVLLNFLNAINKTKINSNFSILLLLTCIPIILLTNYYISNNIIILLCLPIFYNLLQLLISIYQVKKSI